MEREWPLVGRDIQMRLLTDLLSKGVAGGALVAGSAGVGKTRLARDGVKLAEQRDLVRLGDG